MTEVRKRRPGAPKGRPPGPGPVVRRGTVRLPPEIAARVRAGHPWIYREALGGRPLRERTGDVVEVVDGAGEFVGRGLYEEGSAIAVRLFTRNEREVLGADLVRTRVREALAIRRRFVAADVDALRLVNGESDGLPGLAVDRYADYLVVHFFTPAAMAVRDFLYDALVADVAPKGIYEQRRFRPLSGEAPRGPAELVRGDAAPVELEVREGGLRFWVDVTAPLSTGLFLDLREGRKAIAAWATGRRVLNLFSYTGAISVYAQSGGATEVVAVDVAAKAHARARRNFALNGHDPEKPEHIVGDAFKVLARFVERRRSFDLVVLDPPAFGTAARGQVFSAAQDYRDLVEAALGVVAPGGLLIAASATQKIQPEDFDRMLADGAARARTRLRILERRWLPPDFCVAPGFPEGSYLKFVVAARD
jgi:23S rRNA (cytosine1962-C5)-methyltransferase